MASKQATAIMLETLDPVNRLPTAPDDQAWRVGACGRGARTRPSTSLRSAIVAPATGRARPAGSGPAAATAWSSDWLQLGHELRTPLNAMLGNIELLLDGSAGPLAAPVRACIGDIQAGEPPVAAPAAAAVAAGSGAHRRCGRDAACRSICWRWCARLRRIRRPARTGARRRARRWRRGAPRRACPKAHRLMIAGRPGLAGRARRRAGRPARRLVAGRGAVVDRTGRAWGAGLRRDLASAPAGS